MGTPTNPTLNGASMHVPKLASAAALAGLLVAFPPSDADAQVTFFSRSGRDSHFAAGVHGYGKYPDSAPRRDAGSVRSRHVRIEDRSGPVWRESSYLEYRPATAVPHGDHYDLVPGRYRYRSYGYWD